MCMKNNNNCFEHAERDGRPERAGPMAAALEDSNFRVAWQGMQPARCRSIHAPSLLARPWRSQYPATQPTGSLPAHCASTRQGAAASAMPTSSRYSPAVAAFRGSLRLET